MPHHDSNADDEDWYDDESEGFDDESEDESVRCPECGKPVPAIADQCPACRYWLTEADRTAVDSAARPAWIKLTAGFLLLALAAFVLLVVLTAF